VIAEVLGRAIQWCNQNAGFVSAILTFSYVAATIWLVLLSRRQLHLALQLERDRLRPVVIIDLVVELPLVHLSIKNFGPTTARDVKIQVTPPIQSVYGANPSGSYERAEPIPVLENGVPMLPPGKEIRGLVGQWTHVNSYNPTMRFIGEISYWNTEGRSFYREPINVDLSSVVRLRQIQRYTVHDLAKILKDIREDLNNIATGYRKPLVRIITEQEFEKQEEAKFREAIGEEDQQSPSQAG
jgi:hypothetical protein